MYSVFSLHARRPALKPVDMFEFHPDAGIIASRLFDGLEIACRKVEMVSSFSHCMLLTENEFSSAPASSLAFAIIRYSRRIV